MKIPEELVPELVEYFEMNMVYKMWLSNGAKRNAISKEVFLKWQLEQLSPGMLCRVLSDRHENEMAKQERRRSVKSRRRVLATKYSRFRGGAVR